MLAIFINMFVLILGVQSALSHAEEACKIELARIVSIKGTIEIRRAVNNQNNIWTPIAMNDAVCLGDMIRSRTNSRAGLRLVNNSMLRLDQRSSMTFLLEEDKNKSFLMNLLEGAIHIITRTPKPFDVKTPFINASVHGTEFLVRATPENGQVVVYEGKVTASNDYGNVVLNDREAATAQLYQAPQKSINVHPTDAVRWALHYPTITSYWQFDSSDASQMIQRASDLLAVGQADDAQSIIAQVIQKQPDNSGAHALFAIIAVVQGDKEAARSYANQAVQFNAQSPFAYLALSYAQQAQFEIEAALASVHKALELNARNALTWARLAELQMSTGETDRAISSAQEAVRLQPNLAQTQSVLGFAHLLQIDIDSAKEAFNQSIALDSSDPMPRLGLGLTLIRQGQLEAGRIQLEIAASLDPANSLIRSYLGKAYFEERRYPLAGTQFDLAKERDPKDPTPWLYDAIQKQTQNRPIEALQDIQKSIELNDNRAVYRSKFLLDRDEAARGSSLSRIFETLGFERRAVMETAKSLSYDPANHSAHRFLSDTYANTPRHEIARVSELLQAQLLQPINVNPVQPHMVVADLNIITGTTPSAVSFNEFAPLMERNKPQIVSSGIVGSNGTLGNEIVASMQRDRASVSLGQFHYETNGFRPNNDQNHNVYNGFFQYALTPKLNVQAEIRRRETEHGDLALRFSDNANEKNKFVENRYDYHRKLIENTARFGARYAFSPNQDFLISAKYIDRDVNITGSSPSHSDRSGYHIEGQHLYRHEIFNTTIGGGGYEFSEKATLPLKEISRKNIYAYTNINLRPNLTTTLGLSYDLFTSSTSDSTNKINPKFGLQWDINQYLKLRAAWFETTKSELIGQQSLEPTQIAGFNQFYDDFNGTRSRRMGFGLDARFNERLFGGFEVSNRLVKIPQNAHFIKFEEDLYRAYLYWMPHAYWVIRGEIIADKTSHLDKTARDIGPAKVDNLSAPVSLEYFHPSGIFSNFTTTFVQQDFHRNRDFGKSRSFATTQSGTDNFVLVDFSAGFRFPNRKGMISADARNLLDEFFYFMDDNYKTSEQLVRTRFIPDRTFFLRVTLNF